MIISIDAEKSFDKIMHPSVQLLIIFEGIKQTVSNIQGL